MGRVTSPVIPSEHDEQAAFFRTIQLEFQHEPTFETQLFGAFPAGLWAGGSSKQGRFALIKKFQAGGFQRGWPDILYLQPRGEHPYFAVEMKRSDRRGEKNGGLTLEQREFRDAAERVGASWHVCYSAEEAIREFEEYMHGEVKK